MNNPQDRIIKKMIDNIVERNKPEFESHSPVAGGTTTASAASTPANEDGGILLRKIEYGFETARRDNADMRKTLDELKGAISLIRNDMDSLRMQVQQAMRGPAPAAERHVQQAAPAPTQYKKSSADDEWEKNNTPPSTEGEPKVAQARGFQKKDEGAQVDISKVFYYGKK